ncbi:MAG: hypothetical protein MZV64_31280 [Ignavibacteriales bacterium]|nr:hypothetical protein [Ignavibacteriales bacterium]
MKDFEDHLFCIGIDVHKRSYDAAIRRTDGKTETWVCPADPEGFYGTDLPVANSCVSELRDEASPAGFGLARTLRSAGIETLMAAGWSRCPLRLSTFCRGDTNFLIGACFYRNR